MSQTGFGIAVVSVLALGSAGAASAQVLGLPVRNAGVPTGIGIVGEVGFSNDAYGRYAAAEGTTFGGTAAVGFGVFGITATISSTNPSGSGPNVTSYGGTLNAKVFGGPLVPFAVTLQGGIGYWEVPDGLAPGVPADKLHFPLGVGLALSIPTPGLAIKPWIAPRADFLRTSGGSASRTDTEFGISAGIDFSLLMGLGFRASYDLVTGNGDPGVFGAGVSYLIKVPGL